MCGEPLEYDEEEDGICSDCKELNSPNQEQLTGSNDVSYQ
jgi:hypothetical protein